MSRSEIRFGLVGFGAWGQHHAQAIASTPSARLAAITARSQASRDAARQAHPDAKIYSDHRQMLDAESLDIVDVVTPSHTHLEIASDVLNSGCHLLLEKPMALKIEDCRTLIHLAEKKRVQLAVGHEFRLSSQWGEIKRILAAGTIGDPQYVLVELLRKPYRQGAGGWRYDRSRVGSWVLEEPIHFFDLARWYLEPAGNPIELYAYGNSRDRSRADLYDNFSAMFRYPNGAYALVSQTLAAFEHHQTVKISGTRGAVTASWSGALDRASKAECTLRVFDGSVLTDIPLTKPSGEVHELRTEIEQCMKMVRGEAAPTATGRDGLWSVGLCLLAEQSIRERRPIMITDQLQA